MKMIIFAIILSLMAWQQAQARATSGEDAARYILDNDELDTYCDGPTAIDRVPGFTQTASDDACEMIDNGEVE
jgi:hypothetical protein